VTQTRCARCRAWLTPTTANGAGTYCAAPCSAPARPTARTVAARLDARPAPRVVATPKPAPAPQPAPAPVPPPARTVAVAPAPGGLEELRALVTRLEAVAERLERARAPRNSGRARTVAEALAPAEERADEMAILGECVGTWRSAASAAQAAGCSAQRASAILARLARADGEEHPDPLVKRDTVAGRVVWRATAEGEKWISDASAFDVLDGDEVARAVARMAQEHEEEAA
jgi:hypothetical protein